MKFEFEFKIKITHLHTTIVLNVSIIGAIVRSCRGGKRYSDSARPKKNVATF